MYMHNCNVPIFGVLFPTRLIIYLEHAFITDRMAVSALVRWRTFSLRGLYLLMGDST
jgi:hypothetical protein